MFCNQCGFENRNDRKFCANCGAPLKDYTKPRENLIMPEEIALEQEIVQTRNKVKKITRLLMFTFFLLAVVFTIISFFVDGLIFWVAIGVAFAGYLAVLITYIVRNKIYKKLKNKKSQ